MITETITINHEAVDTINSVEFSEQIETVKPFAHRLRIDFAKVTFFGSAAIGILFSHAALFDRITCINVSPSIRNQWELLGLDLYVYCETTPEPAKTTEP